jgi:hypothetical protein
VPDLGCYRFLARIPRSRRYALVGVLRGLVQDRDYPAWKAVQTVTERLQLALRLVEGDWSVPASERQDGLALLAALRQHSDEAVQLAAGINRAFATHPPRRAPATVSDAEEAA